MLNSSLKKFIIFVLAGVLVILTAPLANSQNSLFQQIGSTGSSSSIVLQAQSSGKINNTNKTSDSKIQEAPVILEGKTLFNIQSNLGEVTPKQRAKDMTNKIMTVAQDSSITLDSIRIVDLENWQLIQASDILVGTVSESDAKAANKTISEVAKERLNKIKDAIEKFREARTRQAITTGIIEAIITTIFVIFTLFTINRLLPSLFNLIGTWLNQHIDFTYFQRIQFLFGLNLAKLISATLNLIRFFLILFIISLYAISLLNFFPWTKPTATKILESFSNALNLVWLKFVDYLPNLFTIIIIVIIAYYSIRFSRIFFNALKRETIQIRGFYPEWADTTLNIVIFLIVGLSAVLIFPSLPASNSPGFQGVSLFLGALFTFGSTAVIGNIVSGIVLIYARAFQLEDIIKVNDKTGRVIEKTMLSTRIMTFDNEVITIPNGSLLATDITNYTALIRDNNLPLVLKTTVTLGYDLPWRKVHQALINAAKATAGILENPEPFVLQTSLDDFYISYTLKAFTNLPEKMPLIYSRLHQNIQDKCNEVGIEIMSPHYSALRDGNQNTIPADYLPDDYITPGFRLESISDLSQQKSKIK
jgi:small-conductance mechanosensitive channel